MALRWLLQRRCVTSVVIGVKTLEQLSDNLGATAWALSEADMAKLDALSAVPVPCECARELREDAVASLARTQNSHSPMLPLSLIAPKTDPWEMVGRCQGGRTRE